MHDTISIPLSPVTSFIYLTLPDAPLSTVQVSLPHITQLHTQDGWRTYPLGQNPPVSGNAGRNPQDITPCRIRTQCMMSFPVTGKRVLKAKFQDCH